MVVGKELGEQVQVDLCVRLEVVCRSALCFNCHVIPTRNNFVKKNVHSDSKMLKLKNTRCFYVFAVRDARNKGMKTTTKTPTNQGTACTVQYLD